MYLTPSKNYWAIDIEGDPIPSTRVWCLCAINIATKESVTLTGDDTITTWVKERKAEKCKFIGHNIIGYDAPTLNRLLSTGLVVSDIIDTMLLSMLYSPSIEGGHSLEEWGQRLKYPKLPFSDFSQLTDEMLTYCMRDTELCMQIYLTLVKRMKTLGYTELGLKLEHESWSLIQQQQKNGFKFDIENAHILYAKLRQLEQELQDKIYEIWPPELQHVATFKRPFTKDGRPSANYSRHCGQYEKVEVSDDAGEYYCYGYVAFNIGSPDQRATKLVELGWEPLPTELTPTGKPKPTHKGKLVPSLVEFVEKNPNEGPRLIAQWLEINSRANMINTWIEAYNETTGCIHGRLWLANTLRYRHSDPNTANIPAVKTAKVDDKEVVLYGLDGAFTYEARNLWVCRDPVDRRLVGVDAKGIQLRVLANYLNNAAFTKEVIDGDPHSYNQEIGQFRSRGVAKTFIYAFLLGAGDERVGQIIGGTPKEGRRVKERFIQNFPGLEALLGNLEQQVRRTGRIRLCDGTPLIVSQPHTRLGYLLQGDESRIMKRACVLMHQMVRQRGLDVIKVGDIHDEWQNDVLAAHVDEFRLDVCPTAFRMAGETFNYRVPIDCDAKVGLTWAQTH